MENPKPQVLRYGFFGRRASTTSLSSRTFSSVVLRRSAVLKLRDGFFPSGGGEFL